MRDSRELDPPRRLFERKWQRDGLDSRLERLSAHASEVNTRLVLPNGFLFKVDAASMRHSLEVRVPMLDEDLVAFGLSLPHALRANQRGGKIVLRGVARRRLPRDIAMRGKRGFAVPVDRWIDASFRSNLRELLGPGSRVGEYLDSRTYEPWVRAFCSADAHPGMGRDALYARIVMLTALELQLGP